MEKTSKEVQWTDSLPLRFGSFAEEFVANEYVHSTGYKLIHDESTHIHPNHAFMSAHIDRFVVTDKTNSLPTRILECKTANPFAKNEWGDIGTDEVPMSYLCQCVWYMAITGIEKTDLAVLFGNNEFRIYEIMRDRALEKLVIEKARYFWSEYVLKDIPPPTHTEADCHAIFTKGDPTKTAEASSHIANLVQRINLLNDEIQVREEKVSSLKQEIMSQMAQAETLTYQGKILATWKAPKPSYRIDSKQLEKDHPDLAAQFKIPVQNSRRFVIKHG
jgi:predicted phage-related endonuclease